MPAKIEYYLKLDVNTVSPSPHLHLRNADNRNVVIVVPTPKLLSQGAPQNLLHPPSLPSSLISPSLDRDMDMEGGHNKATKASSGEASSPEPTSDDAGTVRSYYECMFCKRGFTTAQALGGHMNIHRKDRARMQHGRTGSSVSGKAEDDSEGYGFNKPYSNHHRAFYPRVSESLKNYSLYFSASSSGGGDTRVARDDDMGSQGQGELSLFGQELQLGLGTHFDDSSAVCEEEKRKDDDDEEEELDLELRLGRQP